MSGGGGFPESVLVRLLGAGCLFQHRRSVDDNRQRLRNLFRGVQQQEALPIAGNIIEADIRIHHQ